LSTGWLTKDPQPGVLVLLDSKTQRAVLIRAVRGVGWGGPLSDKVLQAKHPRESVTSTDVVRLVSAN
jgi:hypothetical protein